MKAICISCGAPKRAPYKRCRRCGFSPTVNDMSLVKSVYLSTGRFATGEETGQEVERQLRYSKELDDIGAVIRAGNQIEYDEDELTRLKKELAVMRSVPIAAVWGVVFRTFLPGLLFVTGVWLLYLLLRFLPW